ERNLQRGLGVKAAAKKTMKEVGGALVAIGLVLIAVFIPTTFLEGVSGQFYRQFGVTIAVATFISVFVSLTLSPAIAALLLKPHKKQVPAFQKASFLAPFEKFLKWFELFMEKLTRVYGKVIAKLVKVSGALAALYLLLIGFTVFQFSRVPTGFIPTQDQGYFIVALQLPPGASLARTDAVIQDALDRILAIEGVETAISFAGFD